MGRVIAFHGIDSKVGTTMISQSVAELIAEDMREIKVILIACNGKGGVGYISGAGESMDNIRIALESRIHPVKDLLYDCRRSENLFILNSSYGIGRGRKQHPEAASYMIERLRDDMDLIIADCGGELDDGLAIGALKESDESYCVLTQQEFGIERYDKLKDWYHRLGIRFDKFLINKYRSDDNYRMKNLVDRIGMEEDKVLLISESVHDRRAEHERKTLLNYRSGKYTEDIRCIANCILKGAGFLPLENKKKAFWKISI